MNEHVYAVLTGDYQPNLHAVFETETEAIRLKSKLESETVPGGNVLAYRKVKIREWPLGLPEPEQRLYL